MNPQLLRTLKITLGLVVAILFYVFILLLLSKIGITAQDIKSFVAGFGVFGIVVLIILMMLSVMSPVPDTPMAIISVVTYGSIGGFVIFMIGAFLGACADFIIFRRLGRKFFERQFPNFLSYINTGAKHVGFQSLVFFRIFPTVTFDIVSYTAAVTRVKFPQFALASSIGLLPAAITYALLGCAIEQGGLLALIYTIIIGFVVISAVVIFSKFYDHKLKLNDLEDKKP